MTDHPHGSIERHLRSLADRDDLFPVTPDIAGDVRGTMPEHAPQNVLWTGGRLIAILVLVVLAVLATALVVPGSRTAIADFFGIEGIRIETGQDDGHGALGTPESIGGALLLGEETTLDGAVRDAPFDVVIPTDPVAEEPDETYLNRRSGATVVGMLWRASDELPEIGATGVGMLLLEIEADDDDVIFVKKMVGSGELSTVMVNHLPGYWIENGVLAVEPVDGLMLDLLEPNARRSGNVLIWSDGMITYRLETALPQEEALRVAESLAPISPTAAP